MKNIVVAVDVEDNVVQLLMEAERLAAKFEAKLWIVHVTPSVPERQRDGMPTYVRKALAGELREDHRYLQTISKYVADSVKCEALLIEGASAVDSIHEVAEKLEADLIVVGLHEHGFLYNTFVGSTTSDLLDKSRLPVLVIPLK